MVGDTNALMLGLSFVFVSLLFFLHWNVQNIRPQLKKDNNKTKNI